MPDEAGLIPASQCGHALIINQPTRFQPTMSEIEANDSTHSTTTDSTSTLTDVFSFISARQPTARGAAKVLGQALYGLFYTIFNNLLASVGHMFRAADALMDSRPVTFVVEAALSVWSALVAQAWAQTTLEAARAVAVEAGKKHATKRAAASAIARTSVPAVGLLAFGYLTYYFIVDNDEDDTEQVDDDGHEVIDIDAATADD